MRVVVADDVMLVRTGLARLLTDAGIDVVGEAADADGLLKLVALEQPDVAIVDIRMPPTHRPMRLQMGPIVCREYRLSFQATVRAGRRIANR